MKKIKNILILLIVLMMTLSVFSACRPTEDEGNEGEWGNGGSGGGVVNNGNEQTDTPGENTPGENTPGENTPGENTPGENTPGENTPGENTPGENTPGENTSGENTPGENAATNANANPLMSPSKAYNQGAKPSYNIDDIGFSKGKLEDLKGQTITYYQCTGYGLFSYFNKSNKSIDEFAWLKELKKEYGLTVKMVRVSGTGTIVVKPFQAMNAGKDIDVISTHVSSFPYVCNILAPLEDYYNMDQLSANPGINPMMTEVTKWKGKSIVFGANGDIGAWRYNASFVKNAGLADPYELWKKDQWTWTEFKKYMLGLPKTTPQGQKVYGAGTWGQYWYWPNSNDKPCFEIDGKDPNGSIINNWDSPEVKETFVWLESICDAGGSYLDFDPKDAFMGTNKTMYAAMYFGTPGVDYVSLEAEKSEAAKNDYRWVPFPRNEKNPKAINHVELYGRALGLPRKTNKEGNRLIAAKFIDLHCNRWTESRFDSLRHRCKWSQEQILEYFEVGKTNAKFGIGAGVGELAVIAGGTKTNFNKSIADASFSTATCMEKLSNFAKQEIQNVLKFGVQ